MTEAELKTVFALYTDCWKMFRSFHTCRTEEEWTTLAAHAKYLGEKYGAGYRMIIVDTLELIEGSSRANKSAQ